MESKTRHKFYVRVNGRGNAWPILIGDEHPHYDKRNAFDLANASYSLIHYSSEIPAPENVLFKAIIDAGHGTVQNIIWKSNRTPDAIFITHPHIDHTLGLDWILQSAMKMKGKKLPVYASKPCWEATLKAYPQLSDLAHYREVIPGQWNQVSEDIRAMFIPVYHGLSALGAGMFLFDLGESRRKVLFTGDLLFPLMTRKVKEELLFPHLVFADANNCFPYPGSNHWSLVSEDPKNYLQSFLDGASLSKLISPHLNPALPDSYFNYFDTLLAEPWEMGPYLSIFDFIQQVKPQKVCLMHYSGLEDRKYYQQDLLSMDGLEQWTLEKAQDYAIYTDFRVPKVGDLINC
jgi:glyoxylase-like metal-dependent hydrolase (beta-lactamase superfamily II)